MYEIWVINVWICYTCLVPILIPNVIFVKVELAYKLRMAFWKLIKWFGFESPQSICRFIQNVSNESYFFFVPKFTMSVQVCFLTGWTFFSVLYYYTY